LSVVSVFAVIINHFTV